MVLLAILLCLTVAVPTAVATAEEIEVYLGGTHIGVDMVEDGLVVMGFGNVPTPIGERCPAKEGGVEVGDVLYAIDGEPVRTRYDVERAVAAAGGLPVLVGLYRNGTNVERTVTPIESADGYLMGVYLKDGIQGVGTLTFVRADRRFAALGHGIEDPDTGKLATPYRAKAYAADINSIVKGATGRPGELQGAVGEGRPIGTVEANTDLGIYGVADPAMYEHLPKVKVARRNEVEVGDAVIVTTLMGDKPRYYAVKITQCRRQNEPQQKGLSITVVDQRLLDKTGGIVQGMSGSPILQNGRLVGAVTHVTVDQPTMGYGVYIDFMLQG